MEASPSSNPSSVFFFRNAAMDDSYRPLPTLYLGFLAIWCFSTFSWAVNTMRNRHFQVSNLQRIMAVVPLIKAVQLGLSYSFWYSCIKLQVCSLWISFGVYVTGIIFQTASLMSFMLISHGYCIMYEHLSVPERRITAALGFGLYLTLVGYKAAIPYFTVFGLLNYSVSFYLIFRHISQNLVILREELSSMEDGGVQSMDNALRMKYTMFKKFQGAMQIVAVAEFLVFMNVSEAPDNYWLRLLVRECAQFCIYLYIGWTFRALGASTHFSVMRTLKSTWEMKLPPVYRIEMDAADFNDVASRSWQFGVWRPRYHPDKPNTIGLQPPLSLPQFHTDAALPNTAYNENDLHISSFCSQLIHPGSKTRLTHCWYWFKIPERRVKRLRIILLLTWILWIVAIRSSTQPFW